MDYEFNEFISKIINIPDQQNISHKTHLTKTL